MLSFLDPILFPDDIQIFEVSENRYVYPIFKNGSESLRDKHFRQLTTNEITELENIEVFVRDPFSRYISGVQTFLRYNPELDRDTVLSLINRYLFLDRHFTLQFHWLVNLRKFCDPWIYIRSIDELKSATDSFEHIVACDQSLINYFKSNLKLHYYLQLDKIITEDFLNQTVKMSTILLHVKFKYPDLYKEIIERIVIIKIR